MVTDVYSEIEDENRRENAARMEADFYSPTAKNGKSSATEDIGEALAAILKNLSPEQLSALVSAARYQKFQRLYSEIIDEDRRFNAQKMDKEFYSTLNDDTDNPKQDTDLTDSDMALLELIKSLSPEMKEQFLKQALQR